MLASNWLWCTVTLDPERFTDMGEERVLEFLFREGTFDIEAATAATLERQICGPVSAITNRRVSAFTTSARGYDGLFAPGDRKVISVVLESLPVVDERALDWDQVKEIRADESSRRKLRRLLHWLDGSFDGKPLSFVRDEIEVRVDEYQEALRKHGAKVNHGVLKVLLDYKAVATLASSLVVGDLAGSQAVPIVAAAAHLGRAYVEARSIRLELESQMQNSPVSYLCESPN